MTVKKRFHKENPTNLIWWVDNFDQIGVWEFSFDRETIFNMFCDYPWKLSAEQKEIFDRENPYCHDFFSDRQ